MIVDPVTISPDITAAAGAGDHEQVQDLRLPVTRGLRLTGILTTATCIRKNHGATGQFGDDQGKSCDRAGGTTLKKPNASCKSTASRNPGGRSGTST